MEHETVKKTEGTKRTLTTAGITGAAVFTLSAMLRGVAGSQIQAHPGAAFIDVGIILGLFVALLALYTRLQVELDEPKYQANLDEVNQ